MPADPLLPTKVGPDLFFVPGGPIVPQSQTVSTTPGEATASLAYVDLATIGPVISIVIGATGTLRIVCSCRCKTSVAGNGAVMSFALSVGGILAPDDANAAGFFQGPNALAPVTERTTQISGLTPGISYTVTGKYRAVLGGVATFFDRRLVISSF